MNQRDKLALKKIVMFCERIADNLKQCSSFDAFQNSCMCQDACCMCVIQLGELIGLMSDEIKEDFNNVPWRIIKDTRNFYVHKYGDIELDKLWVTLNEDIPILCNECRKILAVLS